MPWVIYLHLNTSIIGTLVHARTRARAPSKLQAPNKRTDKRTSQRFKTCSLFCYLFFFVVVDLFLNCCFWSVQRFIMFSHLLIIINVNMCVFFQRGRKPIPCKRSTLAHARTLTDTHERTHTRALTYRQVTKRTNWGKEPYHTLN